MGFFSDSVVFQRQINKILVVCLQKLVLNCILKLGPLNPALVVLSHVFMPQNCGVDYAEKNSSFLCKLISKHFLQQGGS